MSLEFHPGSQQNRIEKKDITPHIQSFARSEIQGLSHLEAGKNWIVLPPEFYEATLAMCNTERESCGVFLAQKGQASDKGRMGVMAILPLGYGSALEVSHDEEKIAAINRLLKDHASEIIPIDFHTHTTSASPTAQNKFSEGDISLVEKNVNASGDYMHVILTPTTVLTFGMQNPQFAVGELNNTDPLEKQEYWKNKFDDYMRQGS